MDSLEDHHFRDDIGVDGEDEDDLLDDSDSPGKKGKKKRDASALRKAPQAPKRFKSSYICFFMAKQPEIKEELGDKATVTAISKRSAEMWKNLPPDERSHWDEVAAKDKQRYMVEKASYTGPWQVPWKRAKKDPSAPKRPMSAFLYFSQGKRTQIKKQNPQMKNTEVSRLLGEMWRNATEEERLPHIEKEKSEREKYKVAIAEWRKDFEAKQEAQKKAQAEQLAMSSSVQTVEQQQMPGAMPYGDQFVGGQPGAPYMYPGYGYAYPAQPYHFPTNGRQPVVLGPNGTPIFTPQTFPPAPPQGVQQAAPLPAPHPGHPVPPYSQDTQQYSQGTQQYSQGTQQYDDGSTGLHPPQQALLTYDPTAPDGTDPQGELHSVGP